MGETERKDRRIRIDNRVLIALAALLVLTLVSAVLIIPRYGKTLSAYREQRSAYKAAAAERESAQVENTELTKELEELKVMTEENRTLQTEVFRMAARLEKDIQAGKSDKKICYITLDDGPYNRGKEFLRLFKKYDIKVTFFLTTANGDKLPDQGDLTATSMYPEYLKFGNTIGNHTYTHNYKDGGVYTSAKAFMKAVEDQEKFTEKAANGYRPRIVRFPGGTSTAYDKLGDIEDALRKAGYGWVDWTVDSGDSWGSDKVTTSLIKSNVLSVTGDKDQKIMVVLFHEWSQKSLDAMPEIIETLEKDGYIFLPLFYDSVMVEK